ncbi:hypothetical protein MRX96_056082 [Rhipicephalus microplus]
MDLTVESSKKRKGTLENEGGWEEDDGGCEGLLSKANLHRRATLKPKPNIPPDKRSTPTAPGGSGAAHRERFVDVVSIYTRIFPTPVLVCGGTEGPTNYASSRTITANVDSSTTGEPPTKMVTGRRPTFKPRPNLPPDHRGTQTSPPP